MSRSCRDEARTCADRLRARLEAVEAERDRLRSRLAEVERERDELRDREEKRQRIGTHGPGCYGWGYRHYECALGRIEELEADAAMRDATAVEEPGTDMLLGDGGDDAA